MPAKTQFPFAAFHQTDVRVHFYFCLLVAISLSRKQGRVGSNRQKNAFIMNWLKRALTNKTFQLAASDEITWLRSEILRHHPDRDPEPMLQLIYQTARNMR